MIDKEEYLQRINTANPAQLVVINFELIADFLTDALTALDQDVEAFRSHISKAKDGLQQLIKSLNFEVSMSHDFYEIYKYVDRRLNEASFTASAAIAKSAAMESLELMSMLLTGWREAAAKAADTPPVVGEGPKVYAGLTYSRSGQAEEFIAEDKSRGYMA